MTERAGGYSSLSNRPPTFGEVDFFIVVVVVWGWGGLTL